MGLNEDGGENGLIIDGLYIPPIGLYGNRYIGELVWGLSQDTKLKRLSSLREGSVEHLTERARRYRRNKRFRGPKDFEELIDNIIEARKFYRPPHAQG